jgi:NTP pyrophosphatase (non-canonical NTP hydrolase)
MINELAQEIHKNARKKGFFEKEKNIGEMLALIHSEVSEALEADRKDRYANLSDSQLNVLLGWVQDIDFSKDYSDKVKGCFEEEMADIVIRVFDMCAFKGIDIERHIRAKMRYNSMREKYHGKRY